MGRNAAGVIGIKFKKSDDEVIAAVRANDDDTLLIITETGIAKRTSAKEFHLLTNKGGKGSAYYRETKKTGVVKAVVPVEEDQTVFIVTQNGMIIRIPANSISVVGRIATGVKTVNLAEGDSIATVSVAPNDEEEEVVNE